jgi:hypothetical protein
MSEKAKAFAENWVSKNVHNDPLAVDEDYFESHVEDLTERFCSDASAAGIEEDELESAVGDVEDYVRDAFERVFDPTAGGIKDQSRSAFPSSSGNRGTRDPAPAFTRRLAAARWHFCSSRPQRSR